MESKVTFPGALRGANLLLALAAGDIWAMPSHGENFGIAVVEALAAGLPVVISPEVNIAEEIAEEDAGIVAKATAESFADAIGGLLADKARARGYGAKGRQLAARFDWQLGAPTMRGIYDEAIRAHGNSRGAQKPSIKEPLDG